MSELTLKDLISLEEPAVEQQSFRVVQNFSAKNGLGTKLNYRATCLVGNEVYEIQELIQI